MALSMARVRRDLTIETMASATTPQTALPMTASIQERIIAAFSVLIELHLGEPMGDDHICLATVAPNGLRWIHQIACRPSWRNQGRDGPAVVSPLFSFSSPSLRSGTVQPGPSQGNSRELR